VVNHGYNVPLSDAGTSGWGISWYLNGLLIPSVTMYRGTTYTFIVEGGSDPSNQARYHPFYITSSDRGGYLAKSPVEQQVSLPYILNKKSVILYVVPVVLGLSHFKLH